MVWPLLFSLSGGFLIFGQIFSGEPGIGMVAGVAAVLGGAGIAGAMRAPGAIVALVLSAVGAFGGWVWEQFRDGASTGAGAVASPSAPATGRPATRSPSKDRRTWQQARSTPMTRTQPLGADPRNPIEVRSAGFRWEQAGARGYPLPFRLAFLATATFLPVEADTRVRFEDEARSRPFFLEDAFTCWTRCGDSSTILATSRTDQPASSVSSWTVEISRPFASS
jgi:hypothetical protein